MKEWSDGLSNLILLILWMSGVVVAKGAVSTIFSIFFPPWAIYLVIEVFLLYFGVI